MSRVQAVPGWVRRPVSVVSGTEAFLLWVFGKTGSPEVLGSRVSLAWVGGLNVKTPLSARPVGPSQSLTIAEFDIAHGVQAVNPYPGPAWWVERGFAVGHEPPREWWDAHSGYLSSRAYARGVAVALGWAFGVIDDPGAMTPIYREDGTKLAHTERVDYARVLRELSGLPPAGPEQPSRDRDTAAPRQPSR